jgi:AraC-like DNA-binding protein
LRWRNEKPVPNKAGPHYLKTSRASLQALALAYEHFRHPGPGSDHILRAQLTTVHAMLLQQQHAMRKPGLTPAQIQALDNLIIDVGPEHLQPADIGDHLNLSRDYCSRQFRLSFGVAPRTWLVLQRLQGAALLLTESTESISDIAQTYRFADVASLSHAFKKEFGSSPTAYRQRYNQHDI